MNAIHTVEKNGFKLEIIQDENPTNPREDFDEAGTIICWHSRYSLSDKKAPKFETPGDFLEFAKKEKALYLPLYLYEHGGITISVSEFFDTWDSGQVGYIYILPVDGRKEWGKQWRKKAEACLKSEIELFDAYITGRVYGYRITKKNTCQHCGNTEAEDVDSCWGFYETEAQLEKQEVYKNGMAALENAAK